VAAPMLDALLCSVLWSAVGGGVMWVWHLRKPCKKEEHPHEWLFMALAYGRKDLVRKGDPDMDWNEPHPEFGTPLHAIGGNGIRLEVEGWPDYDWTPESNACIKDLLALFEFAMKRGADPAVICPRETTGRVSFVVRANAGGVDGTRVLYDLREPVGGRSAISLWMALSHSARELDNRSPEQLPLASNFFDGILSLLLNVIPKHKGFAPKCRGRTCSPCMAEVPEATARMWQRVMHGEEQCDVVLQCSDGDVHVHSAVLAGASKVLSAMLRWPREDDDGMRQPLAAPSREGWRVPLQDRKESVEVWRVLIYTGLPPAEGLTTALLLDVLDLSHRWQDHLLQCGLLTAALARRIVDGCDGESFRDVLEAALTKELPELKGECLAFARRSREVRGDWERGLFSGTAAEAQLAAVYEVTGRDRRLRADRGGQGGGQGRGCVGGDHALSHWDL